MRSEEEAARAIGQYGDMVRRLCLVHLKNPADTEDIFQNVFLKYVLSPVVFESPEHEKAWLIRVTLNACKDLVKSFFRSRTVPLEELLDQPAPLSEERREVLEAGAGPAPKIPGRGVPPLLRGVHRGGDREAIGEKHQHRVHAAHPGPGAAAENAGR